MVLRVVRRDDAAGAGWTEPSVIESRGGVLELELSVAEEPVAVAGTTVLATRTPAPEPVSLAARQVQPPVPDALAARHLDDPAAGGPNARFFGGAYAADQSDWGGVERAIVWASNLRNATAVSLRSDGTNEFVFTLAIAFVVAYGAHVIHIEPIIGALMAGFALNRLVPEHSTLMNRTRFVGESLFIPFFLLSVGMLLDVSVFAGGTRSWSFPSGSGFWEEIHFLQ